MSQPGAQPTDPAVKKRNWLFSKWGIGIGAFVVGCCVIGSIFGSRPAAAPAPVAGVPSVVPAATRATDPTEISATSVPTPVPMPIPTETPAPTDVPTPIPATATPVPPVELSGSGQTVTDPVTLPGAISRVFLTHTGKRNFIVTAYHADGTKDLLANKIGAYEGVRSIASTQTVYFEIKADGKWTLTIEALGSEAEAASLTGSGDYASGLFMPPRTGPVPYTFTHTGERNFIVQLYCAGGNDVVQNEIGAVDGSAIVNYTQGPCFWEVQADGKWSLSPK